MSNSWQAHWWAEPGASRGAYLEPAGAPLRTETRLWLQQSSGQPDFTAPPCKVHSRPSQSGSCRTSFPEWRRSPGSSEGEVL